MRPELELGPTAEEVPVSRERKRARAFVDPLPSLQSA